MPDFTPKTWADGPGGATPLNATGLNDLESRVDTATMGGNVLAVETLTQAAYDALAPPDADTLYVIVG